MDDGARHTGKTRLFVSYSRKDRAFASRLSAALRQVGYEVWIDLEGIQPSEDWMAAVRAAIESSDAVVFVISPDSVDPSSICQAELDHAAAYAKRLIPVACRHVDTRVVQVPASVGRLNWVPLQDQDTFDAGLLLLRRAIDSDLDWLHEHTRLTVRAAEWQRSGRDDSFTLQKNDLAAAEAWLARSAGKQPTPTALHTEYVLTSRTIAARRRRRLMAGTLLAVGLVAAGGAVAWLQSREAAQRLAESTSRSLAAEAQFERTRRLDRAILLANAALRTHETPESLDAVIAVGQTAASTLRFLRGHEGRIRSLCLVAGGRHLVSAGDDGRVIVWRIDRGVPVKVLTAPDPQRLAVACNPRLPQLATWLGGTSLDLWQVGDDGLRRQADVTAEASDGTNSPFTQLSFSGDGRWLATSDGGSVIVRETGSGAPAGPAIPSKDGISSIALSANGDWVAIGTAGRDTLGREQPGRVILWRRGEAAARAVHDAFPLATRQVGLTENAEQIVAIDIEGDLRIWQRDGKPLDPQHTRAYRPAESRAAAFDASGLVMVNADGLSATVVGTVEEQTDAFAVQTLAAHAKPVTATAIDTSARLVATGDEDGVIAVHRLRSASELEGGFKLVADDPNLLDATFSADGQFVIVTSSEGSGRVDRVVAMPFAKTASAPASAVRVPSGVFQVESVRSKAILHRSGSPAVLGELVPRAGEDVLSTAVTADGRRWAAGTLGTVRIAGPPESPPMTAMLPPSFGEVTALALSPDGRLAAVAGGSTASALGMRFGLNPKLIVLFDTQTGRMVGRPLTGLAPGEIGALSFSVDGRHLLSVGQEAAVWLVEPRAWAARACAAVAVDLDEANWKRLLPNVPLPPSC